MAGASDAGTVHVFKVEYVSKEYPSLSSPSQTGSWSQIRRSYAGFSEVKRVDVSQEGNSETHVPRPQIYEFNFSLL